MRFWRKPLPGVACLRHIDEVDFDVIFGAPSSHREWSEVAPRIGKIFQLEDGQSGGVNPGDRRALFYLTRWLEPASVLEIGTHVGASTLHIAAALQYQEAAKLTTVDVVDVNADDGFWKKASLARPPRESLAAFGASANFVHLDSITFLMGTSDAFDLIFLDGNHDYDTVYAEIPLALRRLNEDGLILLHDYFPAGSALWKEEAPISGPYAAVRQLQRDGADIAAVPLGALPWPTKRGTNLTSLAALLGTYRRRS